LTTTTTTQIIIKSNKREQLGGKFPKRPNGISLKERKKGTKVKALENTAALALAFSEAKAAVDTELKRRMVLRNAAKSRRVRLSLLFREQKGAQYQHFSENLTTAGSYISASLTLSERERDHQRQWRQRNATIPEQSPSKKGNACESGGG
jgi:hypothetical protein